MQTGEQKLPKPLLGRAMGAGHAVWTGSAQPPRRKQQGHPGLRRREKTETVTKTECVGLLIRLALPTGEDRVLGVSRAETWQGSPRGDQVANVGFDGLSHPHIIS